MVASLDRIETSIKVKGPKHKWGSFEWGGSVFRPVMIDQYFYNVQVEIGNLSGDSSMKIFDRYSRKLISARLLAIIERTDLDMIHLGVLVSAATYNKIRSVRVADIDTDPDLRGRFRYVGNSSVSAQF